MDEFASSQISIYIEYWLFVYFGMWMYLCLLPFIRLFLSWVVKNIRIDIRNFVPYSYTISGNHYDLDPDDWGSPFNSAQPQVVPPSTETLDLRCKANENWHIICDASGHYHICLVLTVYDIYAELVLCVDILVPVMAFYQFPIDAAKQYLVDLVDDFSDTDVDVDTSEILARDIGHNIRVDGLRDLSFVQGGLVSKTYWIRIIQKMWKRVYAEKMRLMRLRGGLRAQRNFEISGKYGLDYEAAAGVKMNLESHLSKVSKYNS